MLKRWFLVGVMLLLAALLVVGCGIPQEEPDAVVAERDAAQAEVASLQSDLAATETDLATSESDLATAQSQISSLQSDVAAAQALYDDFKSEVNSSWTLLNGLLEVNDIILNILSAGLLDNQYAIEHESNKMVEKLAALGDSELEALWEEAYVAEDGRWNLYWTPMERFVVALAKRISSEQEALSNKLRE